jgi:hypothetical protein
MKLLLNGKPNTFQGNEPHADEAVESKRPPPPQWIMSAESRPAAAGPAVLTRQRGRCAKPADLPVVQSTKFIFAINLQTAGLLDIEVPPGVLAIADEVID